MKRIITIIIFFLCGISFASETPFVQKKHTETKTIRKEFNVGALSSLFVANKYGNITLMNDQHNKNKITIEVTIKVSSNSQSQVTNRLKEISVDFKQSGSDVSAKTRIESGSSLFNLFGKSSVKMQINYKIWLPVKTKISLENTYGNIFLDKTEADLKIEASYGSVQLNEVYSKAKLNLAYSPNSSIKYIHHLDMNADYSTISVSNANYIKNRSDYSKLKIDKVRELSASMDYGTISVKSVETADINTTYCGVSIGQVAKELKLSAGYASVKIEEVLPSAHLVEISSEYAGVSVSYHPKWDFSHSFSNAFAKIHIPNHLPYDKKNISMMNSHISGSKGKSNNIFKINCEFGAIEVNEISEK